MATVSWPKHPVPILPQQSSHDVPLSETPRHEALHIGHVVDVARLVEAVADLRLIVFREL